MTGGPRDVTTATITAPRVIADGRVLENAVVAVVDGRIADVREAGPGSDAADVALPDGVLAPGLVDLQVNGSFGVDLIDASAEQWATVATRLPETGVTSFLATYITAPLERLVDGLTRAASFMGSPTLGTRLLGVHLEGPFLSETRPGVHDPRLMQDPTPAAVDTLLDAAPSALSLLTLAPERDHAIDAIQSLTQAGVAVSVGHSDATAAQVAAAGDAGARMVTHLFNAQRGLHHREPGVVGRALVDPRFVCGLILDLHHVAREVAQLAFAAAPGRIALVTDAVSVAGLPAGPYDVAGAPVEHEPGRPPARVADGALAGSALRLDQAVANAVTLGIDLATAVDAASRVPADVLRRTDLGRIGPGASADLVWLGDDLRTRATWVAGRLVFDEGRAPARP